MKVQKRIALKERMSKSTFYQRLEQLSSLLDRYYVDAALGFAIPGGVGDAISAVISFVYIFFAIFFVRSFTLTMAITNNVLRDLLLGMIPFYVGDIIDIFHRSNLQNMELIRGYVEGDKAVIATVRRKTAWNLLIFFCLCFCIFLMIKLLIWIAQAVF